MKQDGSSYPQRIIPEETSGGSLASHLKRYDFAKNFSSDKVVLDAGCGVGYGSYYLSAEAREVVGIDISEDAISYAKSKYGSEDNLTFKIMNVLNLTFSPASFDLVCAFELIEHLKDPEQFLREASCVLKQNGRLILSTPHAERTTHDPENPYHQVELSEVDLRSLLSNHFKEVQILGQRRLQSNLHYYLQQLDIINLRSKLPSFVRKSLSRATRTASWDEVSLQELVIDDQNMTRATELIGVCQYPTC